MKVEVYYKEDGRNLQEIIEEFFREYCSNL